MQKIFLKESVYICKILQVLDITALSLLITLEAAQQGRSVLFSDEQKLLFQGWKKGFVKNAKLNFYETLTKPRMRVI
jgi:hypothetical protein